jgi:hypothetical protein
MSRRVYKYLSASHAIDDLRRRQIKVTLIDDLNDPFDLGSIDTTHPIIEHAVLNTIASFKVDTGLLCFSRVWDNILLWSHYANCHTGICLGFDIPGEQPGTGYDMEVDYQPNLLQIRTPADVNYDLLNRMLRTKYEVWSYEQELRMFVRISDPPDENGLQWFDFGPDLDLKEVIIGVQCSQADNRATRDLIQSNPSAPRCYWAGMRKDAFALVRLEEPPPWRA